MNKVLIIWFYFFKGILLDDMTVVYEKIINDIQNHLQLCMHNPRLMPNTKQFTGLHSVLESMMALRRSRDIMIATNIINKVHSIFKILL